MNTSSFYYGVNRKRNRVGIVLDRVLKKCVGSKQGVRLNHVDEERSMQQ